MKHKNCKNRRAFFARGLIFWGDGVLVLWKDIWVGLLSVFYGLRYSIHNLKANDSYEITPRRQKL